jgi:hypothetical protein
MKKIFIAIAVMACGLSVPVFADSVPISSGAMPANTNAIAETTVASTTVVAMQPVASTSVVSGGEDMVALKITTNTLVIDMSRVPVEARTRVTAYLQIFLDFLQDKLSERKRDKRIQALNLSLDEQFYALDAMDGALTEKEFINKSGEGFHVYSAIKIWTFNLMEDHYNDQCEAEGYETCVMQHMLPGIQKNINIKWKRDLIRNISKTIGDCQNKNHAKFAPENLLAIVNAMVPIFNDKQNPNYLRQDAVELYICFEERKDEFYKNYESLTQDPDFFAISDIGLATLKFPKLADKLLDFLEKPHAYAPGLVRAAYRYLSADIFDFPNDPDGSRRRREKKILHQLEQDKDIRKVIPNADIENDLYIVGSRERHLGLKP